MSGQRSDELPLGAGGEGGLTLGRVVAHDRRAPLRRSGLPQAAAADDHHDEDDDDDDDDNDDDDDDENRRGSPKQDGGAIFGGVDLRCRAATGPMSGDASRRRASM